MKILFICKYNRFRSKIAEAFFNKLNKNKKIKAESAGIIRGSPINKKIKNYAKEFKIKINSKPKGVTSKQIKKSDLIVIVADNVPKSIFKGKEIKVWKIKDGGSKGDKINKNSIIKIKSKIKKLINNLV